MTKRGKLTEEERDRIAVLLAQQTKVREIGRLLDREHSTILREIRRNRFGLGYHALHAQHLAEKRKSNAGKRYPLKDPSTYAYVLRSFSKDGVLSK